MADMLHRVPVREQDPKVRATNFDEVCLGYNMEEAVAEAARCLTCKNPQCQKGCPVNIDIPGFIREVQEQNIAGAYEVISKYSALPAVCGRVCPQESQCEAKCIRGIKAEYQNQCDGKANDASETGRKLFHRLTSCCWIIIILSALRQIVNNF